MLLLFQSSGFSQKTLLHCGGLISMAREAQWQKDMTIVVDEKLIVGIEPGFLKPEAGDRVIDLKDRTVMPGLIDGHVHIEWEQSKTSYTEKYVLNEADIAFRSAVYARLTLENGFTTIRDLGGRGVNISLRNAIQTGLTPGPRIVTAGHVISITGGHGDHTTGARWDLFDGPTAEEGIADGPDAVRTAVRTQIKHGADWIKVCATGGVTSLARDGRLPHYANDELLTIVRTARDMGVDVAAHAHGDEGIRRAVEAGVRSIEHGTFMSDSTMDAMVRYGTWYVPTLTAGWAVSDSARLSPGFFPEIVRQKALGIGPKIQETLGRAYRKGVRIAFGTDAGVFPHGKNLLEFGFMAQAGMSASAILESATIEGARLLRMQDKIGSIEVGKLADIIAVRGNPLAKLNAMEQLLFVMKEGVVVRND